MKTLGYVLSAIFLIGGLGLWFRGVDGSGAVNTLNVKLASLAVWAVLFIIVFAIYGVTFYVKRHQNN